MQISMMLNYARGFRESAEQVAELEKVGLDLVWVAEAYGFDGPSFMGYLAAKTERVQIGAGILPIYTRTPTLIAMTAAGLDAISRGAFPARSRSLGAAGHRRVARGAVLGSRAPDTGGHRDLPQGLGTRRASCPRGPCLHPALAGGRGHRPRQAAQDHRPAGALTHPDLGGLARGEERRDDRRGG